MSEFDLAREDIDFDLLASHLRALAHPARLEILWQLRVPRSPGGIVVRPRRKDAGFSPDRAMARQTIEKHLATLEDAGVVGRTGSPGASPTEWVTRQQHVFALIEEMRKLSTIRPAERVDVDTTLQGVEAARPDWPVGPKLVLTSGPWEGRAFALTGDGPWTIGRSRTCDVALSYDPFVSATQAQIERSNGGFTLIAEANTRAAPRVNFQPLTAPRVLSPGHVVAVGRSVLVFQDS